MNFKELIRNAMAPRKAPNAQSLQVEDNLSPGQTPSPKFGQRLTSAPLIIVGAIGILFMAGVAYFILSRNAEQQAALHRVAPATAAQSGEGTGGLAQAILAKAGKSALIPASTSSAPKPAASQPAVLVANANPGAAPPVGTATMGYGPTVGGTFAGAQAGQEATQQNALEQQRAMREAQARQAAQQQLAAAMGAPTAVSLAGGGAGFPGGPVASPVSPDAPIPPGGLTQAQYAQRAAQLDRMVAGAGQTGDAMAAYKARYAQAKALVDSGGMGGAGGAQNAQTSAAPLALVARAAPNADGKDRWSMPSQLQNLKTPYELRAGFVIPGIMLTGINSELPGTIIAQVSQNVYDSATGRYLLIPQGTRIVGVYDSHVAFGQSRVLVAWERLDYPDGTALDIGSMPGTDGAGYSGFEDQVNNHYLRIFGSALLMSGVTAAAVYSQGNVGTSNTAAPSAGSTLSSSLGQTLGQVTSQLISKNLSIAPTLEIRPGFRMNIVVTKDIVLNHPYHPA
jgi:type IV secretion system protein VirB10